MLVIYYVSLLSNSPIEYDNSQDNQKDVEQLLTAYISTLPRSFSKAENNSEVVVFFIFFVGGISPGNYPHDLACSRRNTSPSSFSSSSYSSSSSSSVIFK
jgi:hypothetical protein